MGKKAITWIELINVKISEHKKAGKPAGVSDVMGEAKSDWAKIKAGSHPDYEPGKSTGPKTRKSKKSKAEKSTTRKHNMSSSSMAEHLDSCEKCMKMVKRHMKKSMKGGATDINDLPSPPAGDEGDAIKMSKIFESQPATLEESKCTSLVQKGGDCGCAAPPATPMMGGKKHKRSKKHSKKH
jgi:hypothetical protein